MSKYIIELGEDANMVQVISVTPGGNVYIDSTVYVGYLEQLNSDYINEHFGDLQDTAYRKGFEDGKAVHDKGCEGCKYANVAGTHEPCVRCSNCYPNQWTAKADKIKVGDEVETKDGKRFVVTTFGSGFDGDIAVGVCADGLGLGVDLKELRKTGRHFDIASILEDMRND